MNARFSFVAFVGAVMLVGCSGNSIQRTAYEAVQEVGQQDCRRDPYANCPKRESYGDYQRQRKALESK